ncbi:hypothetical protein V8F33_014193 [Rhypophila sp. PSN 637]
MRKRGRPRSHPIANVEANDPQNNYGGSERSASEATVYEQATPQALYSTRFTPANRGMNATTSEQSHSRPCPNTHKKRHGGQRGHEGSSTRGNHFADLHSRGRPLSNSDANSTVGADGGRFLQRTPTSDASSNASGPRLTGTYPTGSGATISFNDKQCLPQPTGCRPGSGRSGEPVGADWPADQSPGVTPLCTPAQSQVIASPKSPAPMGEVVGNRFQADSHHSAAGLVTCCSPTSSAWELPPSLVRTSAGDTQPPSIPTKARSGYGQARKTQSDDNHSDGQSNEDQLSEGQFDDQTEEAAPTRPRKRQRRDESRGPPHLLPIPPALQSQTQPKRSTRTELH